MTEKIVCRKIAARTSVDIYENMILKRNNNISDKHRQSKLNSNGFAFDNFNGDEN